MSRCKWLSGWLWRRLSRKQCCWQLNELRLNSDGGQSRFAAFSLALPLRECCLLRLRCVLFARPFARCLLVFVLA